jgi:hypothetical protein
MRMMFIGGERSNAKQNGLYITKIILLQPIC